jgi:hypothetical protein
MVGVLFFGHRTQRLCFCYLPNIKSTCNKFKFKILDNSNYINFHGGGDVLDAYVNSSIILGKKIEMQKVNT